MHQVFKLGSPSFRISLQFRIRTRLFALTVDDAGTHRLTGSGSLGGAVGGPWAPYIIYDQVM